MKCPHCPETFNNLVYRGRHMRDRHPEHMRKRPRGIGPGVCPPREPRPNLKRESDTWPGRP